MDVKYKNLAPKYGNPNKEGVYVSQVGQQRYVTAGNEYVNVVDDDMNETRSEDLTLSPFDETLMKHGITTKAVIGRGNFGK